MSNESLKTWNENMYINVICRYINLCKRRTNNSYLLCPACSLCYKEFHDNQDISPNLMPEAKI